MFTEEDFFQECSATIKEIVNLVQVADLPEFVPFTTSSRGSEFQAKSVEEAYNKLSLKQRREMVASIKEKNPNFIHHTYKNYDDIIKYGHEFTLITELSKIYYNHYQKRIKPEIIDARDITAMAEYVAIDPFKLSQEDVTKLYQRRDERGNSFLHLAVKKLSIEQIEDFIDKVPSAERSSLVDAINDDGKTILDLVRYDFTKIDKLKRYSDISDDQLYPLSVSQEGKNYTSLDFIQFCDEARKENPNWISVDRSVRGSKLNSASIEEIYNKLSQTQRREMVDSIKEKNPHFIHPAYKNYDDIIKYGHESTIITELSKIYYNHYQERIKPEIIDARDITAMAEYIATDPYGFKKEDVERLCRERDENGNSLLHLAANKLSLFQFKDFIDKTPIEERTKLLEDRNADNKSISDLVRYNPEKLDYVEKGLKKLKAMNTLINDISADTYSMDESQIKTKYEEALKNVYKKNPEYIGYIAKQVTENVDHPNKEKVNLLLLSITREWKYVPTIHREIDESVTRQEVSSPSGPKKWTDTVIINTGVGTNKGRS